MIRVGGLWKHATRDGREYFAGSFGQAKILIFPNDRKSKPSEPDYVLYFGERQERETQDRAGAGFAAGNSARVGSAGRTSVQSEPDDVPF